jgi:hypothetical protein
MMARATFPHVYRAINQITAEFARTGISKDHTNLPEQYQYRSIDDVTARLAPLLAKHRLCALPRMLRRESRQCFTAEGELLNHVWVLVAYDLVSAKDGSRHSMRVWGEALDPGDKGTAKALSSAYKGAMLQLFCIPTITEEPDATNHVVRRNKIQPEPPQGWEAWTADIRELAASCETQEALARLRSRHAAVLSSLKSARPDLYAQIGETFTSRTEALANPKPNKGAAPSNVPEIADA